MIDNGSYYKHEYDPRFPIKETLAGVAYLCAKHGFTLDDIRTHRRSRGQTLCRRDVVHYLYWDRKFTQAQVTRLLACDHTTVINLLDRGVEVGKEGDARRVKSGKPKRQFTWEQPRDVRGAMSLYKLVTESPVTSGKRNILVQAHDGRNILVQVYPQAAVDCLDILQYDLLDLSTRRPE